MNLHINLDSSHPAYEWLESQADKIGAKGHFGTHIDCYTKTPTQNKYNLAVVIVDCIDSMVTKQSAEILPSLEGKALILHTGNMYENEYGSKEYFNEKDTSISEDALRIILSKKPELILIDSYGIGSHGKNHIELDKLCEASGCFVIENICLVPHQINNIERIQVVFDLEYPSTGKPCTVVQI